ncbi:MAG: TraB/GumN family protein [Sulfurovaceae bacterium]|nr:TraB/GumN family protein [Sulfurovaceae bacterium]
MQILKIFILLHLSTILLLSQGNIDKPFLWKVTKNKQEFYLFGTMHLQVPELQILPKTLVKIIKNSDEVYTEIPMDITTQLKATGLVMRNDDKKLKDILPKELYKEVKWYLYKVNPKLSISLFDKMKVWGVSSTLTFLKTQLKYPNMRAIDKIIYDYAKSKGKSVHGIETIEEQLGIMDRFTRAEQIISLEQALIQLNEKRDYINELKEHYLKGESKSLIGFIESIMFQMPKYHKLEEKFMTLLLYHRNIIMAQRIDAILKKEPQKNYLFAFGVMHFLGKKSVIEYLKAYGYSVYRVES